MFDCSSYPQATNTGTTKLYLSLLDVKKIEIIALAREAEISLLITKSFIVKGNIGITFEIQDLTLFSLSTDADLVIASKLIFLPSC